MADTRQWSFIADINHSNSLTVSDVSLWVHWLFFYPGDGLIYILINYASALASFMELSYSNYGGVFSATISLVSWILLVPVITMIKSLFSSKHKNMTEAPDT